MSSAHDEMQEESGAQVTPGGQAESGAQGAPGRPAKSGKRRIGKVAAWAAAGAVALGLAGYAAEPLWQHWWFASRLCGGTLDSADLAEVLPEERLQAGADEVALEDGGMRCVIVTEDDNRALSVEVMSGGAGIGQEIDKSFTAPHDPNYVFPVGTPGFADQFGPVILQECPKPGRDQLGRKQRLLTRVIGPNTTSEPDPALLRIAASAANAASEKYGCGAKKVPLPERSAEPERRPLLEAAEAEECAWLADVRLPKNPSGGPWEFSERATGNVPITSCALFDPAQGKNAEPAVEFSGWYGDWTIRPFTRLFGFGVDVSDGDSGEGLLKADGLGRTTADCRGEAANFLVSGHPREGDLSDHYLTGGQLRYLLLKFAAEQQRLHGCSG